jgi:hypothetical protein
VAVREKDILGHQTFLIRDPEHIHPLAEWRKTRKIWRGGTPRPWEENVGKCLSLKRKHLQAKLHCCATSNTESKPRTINDSVMQNCLLGKMSVHRSDVKTPNCNFYEAKFTV